MILKYVIVFFCCIGSLSSSVILNDDYWVSVERFESSIEEVLEEEANGWIVFFKRLGNEKFIVHLPEDPVCQSVWHGVQLTASQGNHAFYLKAEEREGTALFDRRVKEIRQMPGTSLFKMSRMDGEVLDLLYKSGEIWVRERLLLTVYSLYTMRTISHQLDEEMHQKFIESFEFYSI